MTEATSCGGVVIFRGKILLLYKNYRNKYEGWVLPKGTVEEGEEYKETAIQRGCVRRLASDAAIIKYVGKSQYTFNTDTGFDCERRTLVSDDVRQLSSADHNVKNILWTQDITSITRLIIC